MRAFVGGEDVGARFAGHGLNVYEVAVIVVDYQHVGVPGDGWLDEAAGEVSENFAGVGGEVGVDEVEFVVGGFDVVAIGCVVGVVVGVAGGLEAGVVVGRGGGLAGGVGFFGRLGFGGALIGSGLVEVPFDHGGGGWRVLADLRCRELGPGGEEVVVNGFAPCGEGR